jgi:hypothetical protein
MLLRQIALVSTPPSRGRQFPDRPTPFRSPDSHIAHMTQTFIPGKDAALEAAIETAMHQTLLAAYDKLFA